MKCVNCGAELRPGARFCAKCGTQQPVPPPAAAQAGPKCVKCGAELRPGARFCAKCGTQQPAPSPAAARPGLRLKCTNCGATLRPGAKFCAKCGTPHPTYVPPAAPPGRPPARPAYPPPAAPPSHPQARPAYPPPAPSPQPVVAPPRRSRWLTVALALGGVFVAVCALTGTFYLARSYLFDREGSAGGVKPIGETISEKIGPKGGEVIHPGGAKVVVPEDVLTKETEVNVTKASVVPPLPVEYGVSSAGPVYAVTVPEGTELQGVVELLLPLEREAGADEGLYAVLRWDGASWEDIGGLVEGDFIRVQVSQFSFFQPVLGSASRKPLEFVNQGIYDAVVRPWTYGPQPSIGPVPLPAVALSCPAYDPDISPNCMSLPLGVYSFCIEYDKGGGIWAHYIYGGPVGVDENRPDTCGMGIPVTFDTPTPLEQAGRCPPAPGMAPDFGDLPNRPVGFKNRGPYDAGVRAWTYVPAGYNAPVTPPAASTAVFAPGAPGGGSSAYLSLPLGTYTWCIDWTNGKDEDKDSYFDYYFYIDDRPVVLDENDPLSVDLAEIVYFDTEKGQRGKCAAPPKQTPWPTSPPTQTPTPTPTGLTPTDTSTPTPTPTSTPTTPTPTPTPTRTSTPGTGGPELELSVYSICHSDGSGYIDVTVRDLTDKKKPVTRIEVYVDGILVKSIPPYTGGVTPLSFETRDTITWNPGDYAPGKHEVVLKVWNEGSFKVHPAEDDWFFTCPELFPTSTFTPTPTPTYAEVEPDTDTPTPTPSPTPTPTPSPTPTNTPYSKGIFTVSIIPPDPGPDQDYQVRVDTSPPQPGTTIEIAISGTDGFAYGDAATADGNGTVVFGPIPGGAEGVVETVVVTAPELNQQETFTFVF